MIKRSLDVKATEIASDLGLMTISQLEKAGYPFRIEVYCFSSLLRDQYMASLKLA